MKMLWRFDLGFVNPLLTEHPGNLAFLPLKPGTPRARTNASFTQDLSGDTP